MLRLVCGNSLKLFRFSIHNYGKSIEPETKTRIHGRLIVDEFKSLKDKPLSKLEQYQQRNYEKHSSHWKELADKYWETSSQRRDPRTDSPPELYDKYEYFTKANWIQEMREYNVIYRRLVGGDDSSRELVLDIMAVPQIKKYRKTADLVKTALNPSHTLLCFGVDMHNNQNLYFFIRDLASKRVHQEKFEGQVKTVEFCDDNSLYYIVQGEDKRAYQLYYKKLGSEKGELLYEESDPEYHLDFQKAKDGSCLILTSSNRTTNEIHVVTKTREGFQIKKMLSKESQSRGFLNKSDRMYLWTDKDSYDFKIKVFDQTSQAFVDFYEPEQGVTITEIDMFEGYIVLYLRKYSKSTLRVIEIATKQTHDINLNQEVCMITPGLNQGYRTKKFIFFVNTPFIYNQSYSYDISERKLTQLTHFKLTGPKFDKNKFQSSVVFAPSESGDLIPISIVQKKNRTTPAKLLLKVYGFYGLENQVQFGNVYLSALENDWVIAYAHVRGGNQLGNRWWKSAILQNKSRAWKDLKECVGYLFANEYTHPSLLVLSGSSAGAITVWNAINNNPYLYKAAILSFPFLDVLNSLLDIKLALTGTDYSEFGNPTQSLASFNTIESYCPYQTIKSQQYPAIFIEAGKNDYRCPLYQTLKFVQRFRQRASQPTRIDEVGDKGLIVSIHEEASHTGSADGQQQARNECEIFGYLDYILLQANKDITYK